MNEPSPYQPPLVQGPPVMPYAVTEMPPVVKVFGILHLVFAALGVLTALWGLFIAVVGNPMLGLMGNNPQMQAQMQAQMEAQLAMQERIKPLTYVSSVLSLLIAVPMIIAGIKILRKHADGLKWSNIYATSSLAAKAVNLVLTFIILIPAMQEMTRGIVSKSHAPGAVENIMSGFMVGGAVIGVVVSCVYPLLSLFLLNRPTPKAWFSNLGR